MKKNLTTILLLLLAFSTNAQKKMKASIETDRFAGLDTAFARVLKDWHAAGFAVAVIEKDKVVFAKGFGYKDFEKKTPVTPNTLFAIGSCTKAFTASLIGLLQKEGKLEYDKPVRNYLPELKFYNDAMNNTILLRDLLTHRTGLPRHDYSWYAFPSSTRDSLVKRIQFMEPSYGVREKWQYNNFMYLLQGVIAEKISGKTWEENISEKIFKPLGMTQSNFTIKDFIKSSDASLGYIVKKDSILKKIAYYTIDAMGPAGSINSNVLEMANWVTTWMNGGKFKGKEILPIGYVTEAISSQMTVGAALPSKEKPDIHFATYGFGWMMGSYKGHYRVEHGGNIDGFSASTCFFPSDSVGIVVLSNQNGSAVNSIVRNLMADRLLKLPYHDWNTDIKASTDKAKSTVKEAEKSKTSSQKFATRPSHTLKEYEGLYYHPGYGTFEVILKQDSLFAQLPKDKWWLRHFHYDIFEPFDVDKIDGIDTADKSPTHIQFHMNEAGDISEATIALEPTLAPLHFTKTPKAKEITKEALTKYLGDYEISGAIFKVYIKGEKTLYVMVPGQPEYELIPVDKDKFSLKILKGFYVQFEVTDKGETSSLTFLQPNGNFKAKKK